MDIILTDTATLRPLALPRAGAAPTAALLQYADVRNRSIRDVTGRDDDSRTAAALLPVLRSSAHNTKRQWSICVGDEVVGVAPLTVLGDSGGKSAILIISLLRSHWGRGIGTAALAAIESIAKEMGVEHLLTWVEHPDSPESTEILPSPTGFGTVPFDHHARFLQRHGYRLEQVERVSILRWTDDAVARVRRLHAEAAEAAVGYRTLQWTLPTPAEHVAGYAHMKEHMSTDTPDADLSMPVEVWDAERIADHDDRYTQAGITVLVTAAQQVETGELCAYNELAIGADETETSHQEDTLVLSAHRGHRLGMLVKTAGLLTWRAQHPQSEQIITYNAEENRPMLNINEAIGFAPASYEGAWKKDLT